MASLLPAKFGAGEGGRGTDANRFKTFLTMDTLVSNLPCWGGGGNPALSNNYPGPKQRGGVSPPPPPTDGMNIPTCLLQQMLGVGGGGVDNSEIGTFGIQTHVLPCGRGNDPHFNIQTQT